MLEVDKLWHAMGGFGLFAGLLFLGVVWWPGWIFAAASLAVPVVWELLQHRMIDREGWRDATATWSGYVAAAAVFAAWVLTH